MTGLRDLQQSDEASPGRARIANAVAGRAVIEKITATGAECGDNPEVELILTIELPGRDRYRATHRQVVSRFVLHRLGPGTPVPVRVDASDPDRVEVG